MSSRPDVLIIGAGAIGGACARELLSAGASVTVLDQVPVRRGAAWVASAGMLAAQVEAGSADPLLPLAIAGRRWFADQPPSFRSAIGSLDCGIVAVAHDGAEVVSLQERVSWQQQQGLRSSWLDPAEVATRWPWLAPSLGAAWSPDDGAVDPQRLVTELRRDAVERGAKLVHDRALALDHDGRRVRGVIGTLGRYAADTIVLAAGAWSGTLANLPRALPVAPVRGQMLAFRWPAGVPSAVVYGGGSYLLNRGDELLVGATVERAGFDVRVTPEGIADLHARAAAVYPALAAMTPLRTWAGLRPGTPDGLPIIGAESRLQGLWYATGHGRNGILLSGITGAIVARAMAGAAIDPALSPAVSAMLAG